MTSGEAQEHLEMVRRGLDKAARRLVKTPSRIRDVNEDLEELAGLMRKIYDERSDLRPGEPLVAALRNIQTHLGRVQLLLEGAVTFYCGAISGVPVQSGVYTARGEMPRAQNRGHLKVEA